MSLLLDALIVYLGADFISGLFHWIEDTYLEHSATNPYIRYVATLNEEHHEKPNQFTQCHPMENIVTSLPIYTVAMIVGVILPWKYFGMTCHTVFVLTVMFTFALFANIFHRFCHTTPPTIVRWLQVLRVLQTPQHHNVHHFTEKAKIPRLAKGAYYCVIGNVMNPLLEYIRFWRVLERFIHFTTGFKPLWYDNQVTIK